MKFIFMTSFLVLQPTSHGQQFQSFINKYRDAIETNIMVGYGGGWKNCDLLKTTPHYDGIASPDGPELSMDISSLRKVGTSTLLNALAASHCVVLTAHISEQIHLSNIIDISWSILKHKRVGIALNMGHNATLGLLSTVPNFPFVIAALKDGGSVEQFLCPQLGLTTPALQNTMCRPCHPSAMSYAGKKLRLGFFGLKPYIFKTPNSELEGVDVRLLRMLEKKMKFQSTDLHFNADGDKYMDSSTCVEAVS